MKRQRRGGFLVGRIHQAGARVFARILHRHGIRLSPPQGRVLFGLWQDGAMPISEIARRTGLGKPALTGMLDRLERDGHVRRVHSTEDRRIILVEPTARDRRSQAAFVAASEEMTSLFYEGFTGSEIDRLEADLARVLENLQGAEPRAR
jgi:DNA-binding MarR family transcriptional regulator